MNAVLLTLALLGQLDKPLVAVRHPWDGVDPVYLPSAINPLAIRHSSHNGQQQAGGQLVRHGVDGSVTVLDPGEPGGNIMDPAEHQAGEWVYYAKRASAAAKFSIHRVSLTTGERQEIIANSGHNLCPLVAGQRLFWCSSVDGFRNNGSWQQPVCFLLYCSDLDGKNQECIGRWHLGSALHPSVDPKTGRISFSTGEAMGGRSMLNWGIWDYEPDGTNFAPLLSSYGSAHHFHTFDPQGNLFFDNYYPPRNAMGQLLTVNPHPTGFPATPSRFVSPELTNFSGVPWGLNGFQMRFATSGGRVVTPFTHGQDTFSTVIAGVRQGFVGHPSWCPQGLLCSWAGPEQPIDPANWRAFMVRQRVCLIPGGNTLTNADQMTVLIDEPNWTYSQPRAVFEHAPLPAKTWHKNDGTKCPAFLPEGTPFALLGSASTIKREWLRWTSGGGDGPEGSQIPATVNDSDIAYVRIYLTRPSPTGDPIPFEAFAGERLEILGDVPVKHVMPNGDIILDGDGNPDTSWLAKIPGDVPFTLAALSDNKEILALARTWHGLRPGEVNVGCGGCHNHTKAATPWESTLAYRFLQGTAEAPFSLIDATKPKPVLEYARDIKPILDSYGLTATVYRGTFAGIQPGVVPHNVFPCRALRSPLYLTLPPEVTAEHKAKIREWIETGAPSGPGILVDDLPPVLYVTSPSREQAEPVAKLMFAAYDLHGTIASTSVKASFEVAGRPPHSELSDLFTVADYVHTLVIPEQESGEVTFTATDSAGKVASLTRTFPSGVVIEPPDPNAARIAEIHARLAELAASDATAQATLAANATERAALLAELESLE